MEIGQKLRELREGKHLSQVDIGKRAGLLQCYVSRVERGRTIPNVETLEKFAKVLGVPLYRLFTDGESVRMPKLLSTNSESARQTRRNKHFHDLRLFAKAFRRMDDRRQSLLVGLARKMARRRHLLRAGPNLE
jgi:transcriptional regulator with XRE-family HTH domain